MNKRQLASRIARQLKVAPPQVVAVLNKFMEVAAFELAKGGKISLSGFGSFEVVLRKGRKGFDPHREKGLMIPDLYVPKFRPSSELKALCQEKNKKSS